MQAIISDLHIQATTPGLNASAIRFLNQAPNMFEQLFILGDLWEYWVGDDAPLPDIEPFSQALKQCAKSMPVYFQAGNRDFLFLKQSPEAWGITLIDDDCFTLHTATDNILMMHGDTLCTADHEYQAFRTQSRSTQWQQHFCQQPKETRFKLAEKIRTDSKVASEDKLPVIMDVENSAVESHLKKHNCNRLIHGHTHRPQDHHGKNATTGEPWHRHVLGDWQNDGSAEYIVIDNNQIIRKIWR